ncbi:apolipoprotein D-like [Panulirus ornatus]|uniref:apolipoprotein D-like n=1 Tax=Panulirus ornatus TaxID=150431 RepID=UPI003A85D353
MMRIEVPIFFLAVGSVFCQDPSNKPFMPKPPAPGPCPTVPVVQQFNLRKYLGRWYEIERFFNPFQDGDCVTADYALLPNGSVSVANSEFTEGELNTIFGLATLGPKEYEGRLVVEFPFTEGGSRGSSDGKPNYNVVATDYYNYAVVYSCSSLGPNLKFEFSWILARRPSVPTHFLVTLRKWLKKVNVDASRYIPTIQGPDCVRRQI